MDYYIDTTLRLMQELERFTEQLQLGEHGPAANLGEALRRKAATIATVIKETKAFRQKLQEDEDASIERQRVADEEIIRLNNETARLSNEHAALAARVRDQGALIKVARKTTIKVGAEHFEALYTEEKTALVEERERTKRLEAEGAILREARSLEVVLVQTMQEELSQEREECLRATTDGPVKKAVSDAMAAALRSALGPELKRCFNDQTESRRTPTNPGTSALQAINTGQKRARHEASGHDSPMI
ncbi:hypothetical protein H2201_006204 [Coniosporium apollinis]|uniref:Uncharacterized protein n=2 Tax=Coniosporium TaxID=2810619 RepID=A0ABQ9NML5_9PEZI|nr:hypothetical protein H2199_007901 [Cladosporium sp. JES 115]KAJ9662096.1 hypothetical protein H2201_006204 [Coniosporium apollinis]